jgi:hypothetical protein
VSSENSDKRLYSSFLALNERFKNFVTGWQLSHRSDARLDARAIAALADIDDEAQLLLKALTTADLGYVVYARRLRQARDAIEHGHIEWLASPLVDSYHTAWFEWHERLLTTLGLKREE